MVETPSARVFSVFKILSFRASLSIAPEERDSSGAKEQQTLLMNLVKDMFKMCEKLSYWREGS